MRSTLRGFVSSCCKIDFFLPVKCMGEQREKKRRRIGQRLQPTFVLRSVPRNFLHHRRPRRDTGCCARTRGVAPRLSRRLLFRRRLSARTLGEKSFDRKEREKERKRRKRVREGKKEEGKGELAKKPNLLPTTFAFLWGRTVAFHTQKEDTRIILIPLLWEQHWWTLDVFVFFCYSAIVGEYSKLDGVIKDWTECRASRSRGCSDG